MEALGLAHPRLSSLSSHYDSQRQPCKKPLGPTRCFSVSKPSSQKIKPFYGNRQKGLNSIRMQVVDEDFELKQMKDMASARKRWEALIREEKVKVLTPKEAGYAIQLSDKTLLDVRPSMEHNKAQVKGSTWIPIFDVDSRFDAGTLSRKVTNFMMGGWWSGVPTLSYNAEFLPKVEEKFTEDTDLIVACQKGLSWTDQQRVAAAKEGWGYRLVFSARLVGLFLVADALFIGAQQVGHYLQEIRSH